MNNVIYTMHVLLYKSVTYWEIHIIKVYIFTSEVSKKNKHMLTSVLSIDCFRSSSEMQKSIFFLQMNENIEHGYSIP